ncbi:type 1 glutamine amidotransferase domain-containing protein, partial [Halolamina salina]|uniref:type 1 glutamine amidotransferase domain-containing protein n=1 Tax=Halolamina salina TaxID=1220023 RepID=UPI003618D4D8
MTDALFIVSEEGYWAEECIDPLTTLDDAGVDVTVATPTGEPPVVDERSLDPEDIGEEEADRLREIHETDERLNDPLAVADAEPAGYDAVVLPGGHGTMWDINQDKHARAALRTA